MLYLHYHLCSCKYFVISVVVSSWTMGYLEFGLLVIFITEFQIKSIVLRKCALVNFTPLKCTETWFVTHYITSGKHKARGLNLALHLVLPSPAPWQQCQAPCPLLRSSYFYTVLKLHLALWRQPRGWCGPQGKWGWHPWTIRLIFVNVPHTLKNNVSLLTLAGVVQWIKHMSANQRVSSQSGYMPGLQARCPAGGVQEATTHWYLSLSPPFLPLSLKINK